MGLDVESARIECGSRKVKTMPSSRMRSSVAGAVVAFGLAAAPSAFAQGNCDWYANTAIKQQQQNERKKCGLSGSGWSSNKASHMAWCAGAAPQDWKRAAQSREQELAACASK